MLIVQFKNGNKISEDCSLEDWTRLGTMILWLLWSKNSPLLDQMERCVYVVK